MTAPSTLHYCRYCGTDHPRTPEFWQFGKKGGIGKCRVAHRERTRAFYEANPDRRAAVNKRHRTLHPETSRAAARDYKRSAAGKLSFLRAEARRHGREATLTVEQFAALLELPCHYCGDVVEAAAGYSLDRVDPAGGYTPENVVTCCVTCNKAKNAMTVAEFRAWVRKVSVHWAGNEAS